MDRPIRSVQLVWAILALLIVSPFIAFGPSSLATFLGKDLTPFYATILSIIMVTGLLMFLLQFAGNAGEAEPLGAMGRVVVLITAAISVGALWVHNNNAKTLLAEIICFGVIFGSLLGLALCYIVRAFRKTPLRS